MKNKKAVVVYQAGIANVFEVECFNLSDFGRDAERILQADFKSCEIFARGLKHAGYTITSLYCNQAGDISFSEWKENLTDAPFHDSFHPVFSKNMGISEDVKDYYNL